MTMVALKPGVNVSGVAPEMVVGLLVIAGVFAEQGVPLIITSVTEGKHGPGSLHYQGRAVDLRLPSRMTRDTGDDEKIRRALVVALGDDFDVVVHGDGDSRHVHVEWDRKTPTVHTA